MTWPLRQQINLRQFNVLVRREFVSANLSEGNRDQVNAAAQ